MKFHFSGFECQEPQCSAIRMQDGDGERFFGNDRMGAAFGAEPRCI